MNLFKHLARSLFFLIALSFLVTGKSFAQQNISLRMTIWSANEAHLKLLKEIADDYQKTRPSVFVTFDSLPFATYTTALTTQLAGGTTPDMAWIFETTAQDFVNSGALYPLSKTLQGVPNYNLSEVASTATERWSKEGVLYAYPFSTSPFALFVNNDLIKKAGAKTPAELILEGQWTWERAIETAATVAKTGKAGLVVRDFNYQDWHYLSSIWNGFGAAPWSEDGKHCTFTDQAMIDALSFIHKAIFAQKAIPGPGQNNDFFAGEAAMTITQISRASLLPKEKGFAWDLVPLPKGPAGNYALIGQAAIGVFSSSKNAAEAAQFVAFMTSPENSAKLAQFFPSARKSLLNAETLKKTNALLSTSQLDRVVVASILSGKVMPGHTGFARLAQTVRSGLDSIWVEKANIPDAMQALCKQLTPLLQR